MAKKSVDEIWAQLNAKPASASRSNINLNSFGGLPGIRTTERVVSDRGGWRGRSGGTEVSPNREMDDEGFRAVALTAVKTGAAYDPMKAGVSPEERDAFVLTFQRDINCLSDPEKGTRRRALEKLHTILFMGSPGAPPPTPAMLQAVACGPLLAPAVATLADPMEKVRELGVGLLARIVGGVPDPTPLLPVLLPALHRRFGVLPVAEPSEEIRLRLAELLGGPLAERAGGQLLEGYQEEILAVVLRSLEDPFHEIKKAGGAAIAALASRSSAVSLPGSEALAAALLANCSHQHSRVRLASAEALGALVAAGVPHDLLRDVIAPALKTVLFDRSAATRKAVLIAVASWLGEGERKRPPSPSSWRETVPPLLPLLLLGVTDPAQEVAVLSLQLLEQVGERFCAGAATPRCGAEDIAEVPKEANAGGSPQPMDDSEAEPGASALGGEDAVLSFLGPPYSGPLGSGARQMVREHLQGLIKGALKDLRDWSVGARLGGSRILHTLLAYAGTKSETHADLLVPALCSSVGDDDADIAGRVVACVHVLGATTSPSVWLPLALDGLGRAGQQTAAQVASALVVLAGLLHAACVARKSYAVPATMIEGAAAALAATDVRSLDHPAVQQQLLASATNLIRLADRRAPALVVPLLSVVLQLQSGQDPTRAGIRAGALEVLEQLAGLCGKGSGAELVGDNAPALLAEVTKTHEEWTAGSPDRQMMCALLWTAEPAAVARAVPMVLPILESCIANKERDPAMRIELLRTLDALLEDGERGQALGGAASVRLLLAVLLPAAVWVAGKTAAAVRFQAVTAIATLFRRQLISREDVLTLIGLGEVLPVLHQCLEEDYYADTRLVSCHAVAGLLRCAGEGLTDESRRSVYPELCKRLDDSSDANRVAACEALEAFAEISDSFDDTNIRYLLERLLIHMDDFNAQIQEAVCKVVLRLARSKPGAVREETTRVAPRHRSREYIQRVLDACAA